MADLVLFFQDLIEKYGGIDKNFSQILSKQDKEQIFKEIQRKKSEIKSIVSQKILDIYKEITLFKSEIGEVIQEVTIISTKLSRTNYVIGSNNYLYKTFKN